jgi:tRNA 2-thiouridine synthesizing protein A
MLELDLKYINCPLPVLKTKKFLATMNSNDTVIIETTDPASKQDLVDFCLKSGNILVEQLESDNIIKTIIKRK